MNYRYEIGIGGFEKWIILYENDIVIWTGYKSFSASIETLINEVYLSNKDNYPELPSNLTTSSNVSGVFVIRTRIVSQAPDQVNLGSYEYNTEPVEDQIVSDLEHLYNNTDYQSPYGITDLTYNENQVELSMTFDNDKLSGNLNSLVSSIKNNIENILNNSTPISSNLEIPVNPKYSLVKSQDDPLSNTFSEESNAGGWYILYQLNELAPQAATQSATQSGTQSGTQSIVEDDSNDVISEDDGGTSNNNNAGGSSENRRNIGIENIVRPTIKIEPIVFKSAGEESESVPIGKKPFIWFNNVQLNLVEKFVLSSTNFLPTVSIIFIDNYGFFDNLRFANDDDRIRIFLDSKNDLIRPIFMEFKVIKFHKIDEGLFRIEGVLNVNKMYTTHVESYSDSTSFDVLRKMAELTGLGYSSNISNTDDAMTWINPGDRGIEFCNDVIRRSYRGEKSFMWGFVDFYYNLNFIDIETQLNLDLTKEIGILTSDLTHIQNKLKLTEEDTTGVMYLSNDRSTHGSHNFFESYKIFNNSTRKSIEEGYRNAVKYYDWKKKEFLVFETESIKSDRDEHLILKSDDEEFLQDNVRQFWEGKLISNNVHDNFHYTNRQNITNLNEIQKIGMQVILPLPNYNLYKFMKIFVLLINQGIKEINPIYNKKLSGEWLITDIQFFLDQGELKQKLKLTRRELGFSQEEISDSESTEDKPISQSSGDKNKW